MVVLARRADFVEIDVGPRTLGAWESYSMESDLQKPADSWSFAMPLPGSAEQRRQVLRLLQEESGLRVFIYLARDPNFPTQRALQCTGIIDSVAMSADRDGGATVRVSGRDNGGLLASSSANPRLGVTEETTLVEMIRAVCFPFGIEVVTEGAPSRTLCTGERAIGDPNRLLISMSRSFGLAPADMRATLADRNAGDGGVALDARSRGGRRAERAQARARAGHGNGMTGSDIERLKVLEAKPQVGETVWEYIDRHCRRLGTMCWIAADGKLIVASPDYDQAPRYRLVRRLTSDSRETNNIVAGGLERNWGALSSEISVYGRSHSRDHSRTRFCGHAFSDQITLYRPLWMSDQSITSTDEANRRAARELARQNEHAFALEYDLRDHGQGEHFYAIDTIAEVVDEAIGVDGLYYVVSRAFHRDRKSGATTRLRLVPKGAIAP